MSQSLKEALEIGLECARAQADIVHRDLAGYKPHKHTAADEDVRKIVLALEALSAQQGAQEPHPLECLHINQGSADAAADLYATEYMAAKFEKLSGRGMHELRFDELTDYIQHVAFYYGSPSIELKVACSWIVSELERKTNDERILAVELAKLREDRPATKAPEPSITLNGRQLKEALEMAWPDGALDVDQGDTEIVLCELPLRMSIDGEPMPAGLYAYHYDLPEEGVTFLDPDPAIVPSQSPTFSVNVPPYGNVEIQQTAKDLSDPEILAALREISALAKAYDKDDFGLPLDKTSNVCNRMIAVIRKLIAGSK